MENIQLLGFNILCLQIFMIWPENGKVSFVYSVKSFAFYLIVYISAFTVVSAIIRQILVELDDVDAAIDSLIGTIDYICCMYMKNYFLYKVSNINKLIESINDFKLFCKLGAIQETEKKVRRYSKAMIFYCFFGNVINSIIPLVDREACNLRRKNDLLRERDPCGLMCRCFYPFNVSEDLFFGVYFIQFYTCTVITMSVIVITMTLVGIMIHISEQLHHCRLAIKSIEADILNNIELTIKVRFIIRYHIKIIEYSENANEAFSGMMLLHLTLTSLVISVLGYEVFINFLDDHYTDSLRFFLHLFGWLVLLSLVCFYGQLLIDESIAIGNEVCSLSWFKAPDHIQKNIKMILMRSQKPLQLSAANMGNMSLPTLLRVLSNAYSYFTLLLKIKA